MSAAQCPARQTLEANLDLIADVIRSLALHHRLRPADIEEFSSCVWLKLVEGNDRILRAFQGESSLRTYLTRVIYRLLLDFRIQTWGKWRPCAEARRLGPEAVSLDRLLSRDGYPLEQALAILGHRPGGSSRDELRALAASVQMRARVRPRWEGAEALDRLPASAHADERIVQRERRIALRKVKGALATALQELPAGDRLILKMRYKEGLTVRKIASLLEVEDRALYRQLDRCLARLRTRLQAGGHALP